MSTLKNLSRLLPGALHFQKAAIPALRVDGFISHQTTIDLTALLEKIPKNKDKIAIIINSPGGCYAQTTIIARKIAQIARRNKAEVWTFAQEWATNAGFLLLSTGDKVFVDKSSVVGSLEVGESKLLRGKFGQYVSTVTYSREPSYLSEINRLQAFDSAKKTELEGIYSRFSQEAQSEVRRLRGIPEGVDLNRYYFGEEAVKYGLADEVDTYHNAYGRLSLNSDVRVVEKSPFQRTLEQIRRLNISD